MILIIKKGLKEGLPIVLRVFKEFFHIRTSAKPNWLRYHSLRMLRIRALYKSERTFKQFYLNNSLNSLLNICNNWWFYCTIILKKKEFTGKNNLMWYLNNTQEEIKVTLSRDILSSFSHFPCCEPNYHFLLSNKNLATIISKGANCEQRK